MIRTDNLKGHNEMCGGYAYSGYASFDGVTVKEVLEEISQNEHERYRAELRQKYIMDQKAVEEAGFDKGLTAGIKQNQIKIAKKLLKKGTKLEEIIELTDLTKDEIISIKDK